MEEFLGKSFQQTLPVGEPAEQRLESGSEHAHSACSVSPSDHSRPLGGADAAPIVPSKDGPSPGSAMPLPKPAPASSQQQQGGSSSAKPGGLSGPTQQSGPRQKPESSVSSRCFTPAQRAVAAALMVVIRRAMEDGAEAAVAARLTLTTNNPATKHLLRMLPVDGPLPAMKMLEQRASSETLGSLTLLARQCAEAHCQALEVFTRSVQCTTRKAVAESIMAQDGVRERQHGKHLQRSNLAPGWLQQSVQAMQELGAQPSMSALILTFLNVYRLLLSNQKNGQAAMLLESDLDRMLPGSIDALEEVSGADVSQAHILMRLIPAFTAALQAYQIRAAQCGQSFEHRVLLEAAVHGWSPATETIGDLLCAVIAAEPCVQGTQAAALYAAAEANRGGAPGTAGALEADKTDDIMAAYVGAALTSSQLQEVLASTTRVVRQVMAVCHQASAAAAALGPPGAAGRTESPLAALAATLAKLASEASQQDAALSHQGPAAAAAAPAEEAVQTGSLAAAPADESGVTEAQQDVAAMSVGLRHAGVTECQPSAVPAAAQARQGGTAGSDVAEPSTGYLQQAAAAPSDMTCPAGAACHQTLAPASAAANRTQSTGEGKVDTAAEDKADSAPISSAASAAAAAASPEEDRLTELPCHLAPASAAAAAKPSLSSGEDAVRVASADSTRNSAESGLQTAVDHTAEAAQNLPASPAAAPQAAAAGDRTSDPARVSAVPAAVMPDDDLPMETLRTLAAAPATESTQSRAVLAEEEPGRGLTPIAAATHSLTSTAVPAEPEQAHVAAVPDQETPAESAREAGNSGGSHAAPAAESDQQAAAASSRPASAAVASHSGSAEATPVHEQSYPLHAHELRVAAALLVVLSRALKNGRAALAYTKKVLAINNPFTTLFSEQLPHGGELPSLKWVAESAPVSLRHSLGLLAHQCKAAGCQPLEVFTRSAQCHTHHAALVDFESKQFAAKLQRLQAIKTCTAGREAAESEHEAHCNCCHLAETLKLLAQHGVSNMSRNLMFVVLHEAMLLLRADKTPEEELNEVVAGSATSFVTCIDHMLPGVLDGLLEHEGNDLTSLDALLRMVAPLESALQAYRDRAVAAKKSHAHVVMLEAAVQGWPVSAPHETCLIENIVAAVASGAKAKQLPASVGELPAAPAMSGSAQAASAPEQVLHSAAPEALREECPPNIRAILSWIIASMEGSEPEDLLERTLSGQEKRAKALVTHLFPGIMEELCCALDSKTTSTMCDSLFIAADRHVQSSVQVWMVDSLHEKIGGFPDVLHKQVKALGFEPSEVPHEVQSAIYDTMSWTEPDPKRVVWHRLITTILAAMQDIRKAGGPAAIHMWLLEALAQLIDLQIYDRDTATVDRAARILMPGIMPMLLRREFLEDDGLVKVTAMLKDDLWNHAIIARMEGSNLRAHLEERAGYGEDSWYDVSFLKHVCVLPCQEQLLEPLQALKHAPGDASLCRGAGENFETRLIDILVDCVEPELSTAAAYRGAPFGKSWTRLKLEYPLIASILQSAFLISITMDAKIFDAVCYFLPGCSDFVTASRIPVTDLELQRVARIVTQQLQVHNHIVSVIGHTFSHYMENVFCGPGSSGNEALHTFRESVLEAKNDVNIDLAMAKRMHISMCIKRRLRVFPDERNCFMALLDAMMSICAESAVSSQIVKAIRHALPGVLECLFRLHKWPQGLDDNESHWRSGATRLVRGITARHAREAAEQGVLPEAHLRGIMAVPGLQDADAQLIVGAFRVFWASQSQEETAGGNSPIIKIRKGSSSGSPVRSPMDNSTTSSRAKVVGAAATGGRTAAEPQELRRQGSGGAADAADDIIRAASVAQSPSQGPEEEPKQDMREAAEPQIGLSEAEKAEKRKAKKARQRAARAQAAAQTAQAESRGSKEQGLAEGVGSVSKHSAEAQASEQPLEAFFSASEPVSAAPDSLPAQIASSRSSQAAASSRDSSLSPQPSPQLHTGGSQGQLERDLPSRAAPAAQAPAPAAQEEEPWQEVRWSRRKPASQQTGAKARARRAPKQGRGVPDQDTPALSASHSGDLQAATQQGESVLLTPDVPAVHHHAHPGHAAAEQLPPWLPALTFGQSRQPSWDDGTGSPQSSQPQVSHSAMQHEPVWATSSASFPDEAHPALEDMPQPALHFGSSSHERVRMPARTGSLYNSSPSQTARADVSNESRDDDDLCIVCWEQVREVIFYHCMHMCTCQGCAKDVMAAGALCPMCRTKIQSTITARF